MRKTYISSVKIRLAKEEDFQRIKELNKKTLWQEIVGSGTSGIGNFDELFEKLWATFLKKEGNAFYVAEDSDGEIAGELWFGVNRELSGEEIGWVYDITVDAAYQGKGVGTLLMAKAEEHARANGFKKIGLMVNAKNTKAFKLYKKIGLQTRNFIMFKDIK